MIDLQNQRRRKAIARVQDAIAHAQRSVVDALDQVSDAIDALALAATPAAPAVDPDSARLLDIRQAAKMLDMSSKTLARMVENRQIPFVELPSATGDRTTRKFRVSDLAAYLDSRVRVAS